VDNVQDRPPARLWLRTARKGPAAGRSRRR